MFLASKRSFWLGWAIVLVTNLAVTVGICWLAEPLNLIAVSLAVFTAHMAVTLVAVVGRVLESRSGEKEA